jgi:hypothetical protein
MEDRITSITDKLRGRRGNTFHDMTGHDVSIAERDVESVRQRPQRDERKPM